MNENRPLTSSDLLRHLPVWTRLCALLGEGKSVLLSAPRYCWRHELLLEVRHSYAPGADCETILLESQGGSVTGRLDYGELWEATIRQLNVKSRLKICDGGTFDVAFRGLLKKRTRPLIVLISGAGRGYEDNLYELISKFHGVVKDYPVGGRCSVQLMATDDYSLWYHERAKGTWESEWCCLTRGRLQCAPFSLDDLCKCIDSLLGDAGKQERKTVALAEPILEVTGGHIGLVGEILLNLSARSWHIASDYWEREIPELLATSWVMEGLRHSLQEDQEGLAQTALEYIDGGYPSDYNSPRIQFLRQLGILQWRTASSAALIGGTIRTLVENVARTKVPNRLGTVVSHTGLKWFEAEEFAVHDDDFVVLHLSDVHVGDDHGFRFAWNGGVHCEGQPSLAELIGSDVNSLGLTGRVDALVVSGDIACSAKPDEYERASEVIRALLDASGVDQDRLIIVAGNHDVDWSPDKFAARALGNPEVSREAFDRFAAQFGKQNLELAKLTPLVSRSNRNRLRLVTLDSNCVEGHKAAGVGYVSREALDHAGKLLDAEPTEGYDTFPTWLVMHHHVYPVTASPVGEARQGNVSVMGNASELLVRSSEWKAELILHGHQHQPLITMAQRWHGQQSPSEFSPIGIVGAGSAGAKRERLGPISRNHFYVIVRQANQIIIRSRLMGEEGLRFAPNGDLALHLHADSAGDLKPEK